MAVAARAREPRTTKVAIRGLAGGGISAVVILVKSSLTNVQKKKEEEKGVPLLRLPFGGGSGKRETRQEVEGEHVCRIHKGVSGESRHDILRAFI